MDLMQINVPTGALNFNAFLFEFNLRQRGETNVKARTLNTARGNCLSTVVAVLGAVVLLTSGCSGDSGTNPVPVVNPTASQSGTTDPGSGTTDPGGGTTDPSAIVPTWFGIQANILQPFCVPCHQGASAPRGLSWEVDRYTEIVTNGRLSTESNVIANLKEIDADPANGTGNPDLSYMVWKLEGQGPNGEPLGLLENGQASVRMPATGIPLDPQLIEIIKQWISAGAPLGVPEDATSGGGGPPPPVVGSWMYVWTNSLQVCTLCHSPTPSSARCGVDFTCPPKGVVLTADNYDGVVDNSEVRPGNLDGSKLWERVTDPDPDKRMPFGLDPLNQTQLNIIRDWILDGAPFCPTGETCPP